MSYKKIEEVSNAFWENEVNDFNKEIIEDFLSQEHLSPKTLKQYTSALKIFAKWVHDHARNIDITELKPRHALNYQNWLIKKGLSTSGVKLKRSAVSSLCGFIEVYYNDEFPNFRNIYTKAIPKVGNSAVKEKIPLTVKEIDKLIKHLTKEGEWQKIAYIWFTYSSGCRKEEARQLLAEVADYDYHKDSNGNIKTYYMTHQIRAKGSGREGNVRRFTFDDKTKEAINKWLEIRREQVEKDNCPYVFVSKQKGEYKQLSENTFNLWCKKFSEILGGRPVHPHLFRSSRATNAVIEEGKDIKAVQKLLGHSSSQTTEIYVVRDDSEDLDDLY